VSPDDGSCDKHAQANVMCSFRASASERLEDLGLNVRRNRVSVVVDHKLHALARVERGDGHRRLPAVFDRVANKIGHDLGEPVGIPFTGHVPA
jgi:hypothetical protein